MAEFEISGQIIDILSQSIFPGTIVVEKGIIREIRKKTTAPGQFILPGYVDAHVHIESSMLVPSEFARLAVVHGTVATVSDPHEIGNVLGSSGVQYMIDNAQNTNFKAYFGAPSCVPATSFETAGSSIGVEDIKELLANPYIYYLAEMMNWPGVLQRDPEVMQKITEALKSAKPVDGHAPGLRGEDARRYAQAGITTDHECSSMQEALDKISCGMHILIREGSAAKNFEALIDLLPQHIDKVMLCSDDKHPDNLVEGHINLLVARGVHRGIDPLIMLRAACYNPVKHYNLDVGLLQEGDPADFQMVDNLQEFTVLQNYINGTLVAENGNSLLSSHKTLAVNQFNATQKSVHDFKVPARGTKIRVIEAQDGQLVTKSSWHPPKIINGMTVSDVERDILKITVVNRYQNSTPAVGFIQNFGLKGGAIASSVAHDSHNIIAVGVDDDSICQAVNEIITAKGGVVAINTTQKELLPLPVAGLMSDGDGYQVAAAYSRVDALAKALGSDLQSPFMTLSFMALLVIPELKLSDLGLFDGLNFKFVDLCE